MTYTHMLNKATYNNTINAINQDLESLNHLVTSLMHSRVTVMGPDALEAVWAAAKTRFERIHHDEFAPGLREMLREWSANLQETLRPLTRVAEKKSAIEAAAQSATDHFLALAKHFQPPDSLQPGTEEHEAWAKEHAHKATLAELAERTLSDPNASEADRHDAAQITNWLDNLEGGRAHFP